MGVSRTCAHRWHRRYPRRGELDPGTGERIRAGRATGHRYEREAPGDLLHLDVKKLGRIPDGGRWRIHGRSEAVRGRGIGFDCVHVAVDDRSGSPTRKSCRMRKARPAPGFLTRAASFMAANGAPVQRVMTDNALAYRNSRAFQGVLQDLGASHSSSNQLQHRGESSGQWSQHEES